MADHSFSEETHYHINVEDAYGPVIGDNAHVEQYFHLPPPSAALPPRDELLAAFRQASAELRNCPNEIAGIHIERTEVADIVDWILNAQAPDRVGMLLDQPGGGKTVVMRGVLEKLENQDAPILAIKADSLSGIKNRDDLAARLGLPAPLEVCVQHLATEGPIVVLIDQIDALSLALSRDQTTLDVMLSTIARLRDLESVRVVASCRTFDLNTDPRLSTIKVDRKFELQTLSDSQVNLVLKELGINPDQLLPDHWALLRVPLHLSIYAQIVANAVVKHPPESFRTLQELYDALWTRRIEANVPHIPKPSERIAAIYRLVESMQNRRQLSVPVGALDEYVEAASYLEREGFIRRERGSWVFYHQTLFDYCFARRFIAQGRSLSQEILNGPQGLFERSQMVQVLAYLRGHDDKAYFRELTNLLFAEGLRVHLHLLLIGWFGSFPRPTDAELHVARRLMEDDQERAFFLQAAGGNEDWFDLLDETFIPRLLRSAADEELDGVVIPYLSTLIQRRTDAILDHLYPFLGQNEAWDARIAFCLARLEDWQSEQALDMLCDLLRRGRMAGREGSCLYSLANSNPAAGCRALRVHLDYRLDEFLNKMEADHLSRYFLDDDLLDAYAIGKVLEAATSAYPEKVIEHLLPWFIRAVASLTEPTDINDRYPSDPVFARGWYGEHISKGAEFAWYMVHALQRLARTKPADFRAIAARLAAVESLASQRVLAVAYLADPETYADDIFEFILADERRLNIGDLGDPFYDSWRLYGAIFGCVDAKSRERLERMVLEWRPEWERRSPRDSGLSQLYFLKSAPTEMLNETALRRLRELERKFPGFEPRVPRGTGFVTIGSPIDEAAQAKMSDEAWLSAMRKYNESTARGGLRKDPFKGGIEELARDFAGQVQKDPERFYRLARRFDETIPLNYMTAAISGLAESDAPAEWVFDLVRRFASRIEGEYRIGVCRALEKRAKDGVPDDLLNLMTDWARTDPNPNDGVWPPISEDRAKERSFLDDPYQKGSNSIRGVAVQAVSNCALSRQPKQFERAFLLLEQASSDPSTAVRTCVIESLGMLLNENAARALAIFERTLDGHPALLQSNVTHNFLYWTYYDHFPQTQHLIKIMLTDADANTRQAGARLTCLAAFKFAKAKEMERQLVHGDVAMRRGAAQVYARNLEKRDVESICQNRLLQLMHDPDEQVRIYVGESFQYLRSEHSHRLRVFIEEFLASPSLLDGAWHLLNYFKKVAVYEHELTLKAVVVILNAIGDEIVDIRTSSALLEQDLVHLPLNVYSHADDPAIKSRAMDLFERLLLMGSRAARQALEDWDRR